MSSFLTPVNLESHPRDDWTDDERNSPEPSTNTSAHSKLLKKISRLDKTPLSSKKIKRTAPAGKLDDNVVLPSTGKGVSLSSLLKKSDKSKEDKAVKQRLASRKESKILPEPLQKIDAQKLQRTTAYEEVSKDLKKWDPIISENRLAEGVSFPLDRTKLKLQTTAEYVNRYTKKTPLEQEIAALLSQSKCNLTKDTVLTEAEKEALQAMSFEEAKLRQKELQKMRAILSYKEQKARWQAKIKSKGYHRHLRRAKRKMDDKDFVELQKTDPEAALAKLELVERRRAEERLTLKHGTTGKWARNMAHRAKTDKGAREAIQEQLRVGRALKEKKAAESDDSDEDGQYEDDTFDPVLQKANEIIDAEAKDNPWLSVISSSGGWKQDLDDKFKEIEDQEEAVQNIPSRKAPKRSVRIAAAVQQKRTQENQREHSLTPDFDDVSRLVNGGEEIETAPNVVSEATPNGVSNAFQKKRNTEVSFDIDPSNLITIEPRKAAVKHDSDVEESDSEVDEQHAAIAEAFADDDVVTDFKKEKDDIVDKQTPKDIDLTLPGWGEWAGAGLAKTATKKKKKFVVKAPVAKPRKDRHLANVIISEKADEKLVPHQVKELPFPFTTVQQFHSAIRAPVGKTWNTESAFEEMTKPKFTTKLGTIIKPMNRKSAMRKAKRKKEEEDVLKVADQLRKRIAVEEERKEEPKTKKKRRA